MALIEYRQLLQGVVKNHEGKLRPMIEDYLDNPGLVLKPHSQEYVEKVNSDIWNEFVAASPYS